MGVHRRASGYWLLAIWYRDWAIGLLIGLLIELLIGLLIGLLGYPGGVLDAARSRYRRSRRNVDETVMTTSTGLPLTWAGVNCH